MKRIIFLLCFGLSACAIDPQQSVLVVNKTTSHSSNLVEYELQDYANTSIINSGPNYCNHITIYASPGMYNTGDVLILSSKK